MLNELSAYEQRQRELAWRRDQDVARNTLEIIQAAMMRVMVEDYMGNAERECGA